jgi:hypothetical protein
VGSKAALIALVFDCLLKFCEAKHFGLMNFSVFNTVELKPNSGLNFVSIYINDALGFLKTPSGGLVESSY